MEHAMTGDAKALAERLDEALRDDDGVAVNLVAALRGFIGKPRPQTRTAHDALVQITALMREAAAALRSVPVNPLVKEFADLADEFEKKPHERWDSAFFAALIRKGLAASPATDRGDEPRCTSVCECGGHIEPRGVCNKCDRMYPVEDDASELRASGATSLGSDEDDAIRAETFEAAAKECDTAFGDAWKLCRGEGISVSGFEAAADHLAVTLRERAAALRAKKETKHA